MKMESIYMPVLLEDIIGRDDDLHDFETLTPDDLHPYTKSMALSVFRELTADMKGSVSLDKKATKKEQRDYELVFDLTEQDDPCSVRYAGYHSAVSNLCTACIKRKEKTWNIYD